VNDLGGTLMEENISRLAGSYHGVKLEPDDLIAAAHAAGRTAAERTTLYGIRKRFPLAEQVLAAGTNEGGGTGPVVVGDEAA
jgi:FO synthase